MENWIAYIGYRCLTGFFNDKNRTDSFFYVVELVTGDIPGYAVPCLA